MNELNWKWLKEILAQRIYMSDLGSDKQGKISVPLNMMMVAIEMSTKW